MSRSWRAIRVVAVLPLIAGCAGLHAPRSAPVTTEVYKRHQHASGDESRRHEDDERSHRVEARPLSIYDIPADLDEKYVVDYWDFEGEGKHQYDPNKFFQAPDFLPPDRTTRIGTF